MERIVSLAFRDVRSTSLGKGPHRDSQDVAIVAVEQPFIPFADRVGFEAFIAIARHCVIDRRQELHSVQFTICKVVIQIDMIGLSTSTELMLGASSSGILGMSVGVLSWLIETRDGTVLSLIPTSSMVSSESGSDAGSEADWLRRRFH